MLVKKEKVDFEPTMRKLNKLIPVTLILASVISLTTVKMAITEDVVNADDGSFAI